jgi:hypothetical protein
LIGFANDHTLSGRSRCVMETDCCGNRHDKKLREDQRFKDPRAPYFLAKTADNCQQVRGDDNP